MSKNLRNEIYHVIETDWPIHISGIARKLNMPVDKEQKRVVGRIKYHIDQLRREEKIITKKIDRAVVAWPHEIEKLRVIHEMLK